jgi:hypothetical protein
VLRLIRRPAFPGELNHELVWPAAFLGGALFAWIWFGTGIQLPECVFHRLTGLPCLGCGGTRCARNLVHLDFGQAFLFHPGFFLVVMLAAAWTTYSAVFWVRRDTLRLRLVVEPAAERRLRIAFVIVLVVHWAWQCYYLTR